MFESWASPTQSGYEQSRLVWPAKIDSNYFLNTWGWQSLPFSGGDHGFPDADGTLAEAHAAIVKFPPGLLRDCDRQLGPRPSANCRAERSRARVQPSSAERFLSRIMPVACPKGSGARAAAVMPSM